jgi:hypothetical protein
MAYSFINQGSNLQKKSAMATGMNVDTKDAAQLGKMEEQGAIVTPTNIQVTDLVQQTTPIVKQVGGTIVSGHQDNSGNFYVVDENSTVLDVRPNPVTPVAGIPGQVLPGPGGGGVRPTPMPPPPIYGGPPGLIGSGKIFSMFENGDIIPNQQETITRALWSGNVGNLLTFFTSSAQTATQKRYYYEIFNSASTACGSEAQFSIAYGHALGSGSADEGGQVNDTPSRAIYSQYKQLCLDPGSTRFSIGGRTVNGIYVINVNRARMREYIDEGNIEINLHALSGSQFRKVNAHTGSNVKLGIPGKITRLIDDSTLNPATITTAGEVYNIVSGSIENGVYNSANPHIFGKLFRRLGVVILSAPTLDLSCSFLSVTGSEVPGDNAFKLYKSISGSARYTDVSGDRLGFAGRSAEKVKSTHYFVRVKNGEYNFSNNPTFVTGSTGDLAHPSFINDPRTYITTVGLYNNNKELVAVAKLSKAIQKSFTKEALIKVKLDFVFVLGMFSLLGSIL